MRIRQRNLSHCKKLVYVTNRVRLDISTTMEFLCTSVSKSTEGDCIKLRRVLEYQHIPINMKRMMGKGILNTLMTYVDESYTVYVDMKRHTRELMSLGKSTIHIK